MKLLPLLTAFLLFANFPSANAQVAGRQDVNISTLKTFGTMGKEQKVLKKEEEAELFSYEGTGVITHMWFGGSFKNVEFTRIRIYVDGEESASIDMELFPGHGIGFGNNDAPWGTERMGNIGGNSGIYNTYKIPFGSSIRITAQLAPDADEEPPFWWIIRGTENLPVVFNGVQLPEEARLRLHKVENYTAEPLEEFNILDTENAGMLYQVFMQAKSSNLSYMEAVVRAYLGEEEELLFLSSGLEDYFLGTYYFNTGKFANKMAGLTHFEANRNEFSAYRLHEDDPVFFQEGLRLTARCGEKIGDRKYFDPQSTEYTTYVWVYEW